MLLRAFVACAKMHILTRILYAHDFSMQAFDYALKVENDGRELMARLNKNMGVVLAELSKKEAYVPAATHYAVLKTCVRPSGRRLF